MSIWTYTYIWFKLEFLWGSAGNKTQSLVHVWQILHHWVTSSSLKLANFNYLFFNESWVQSTHLFGKLAGIRSTVAYVDSAVCICLRSKFHLVLSPANSGAAGASPVVLHVLALKEETLNKQWWQRNWAWVSLNLTSCVTAWRSPPMCDTLQLGENVLILFSLPSLTGNAAEWRCKTEKTFADEMPAPQEAAPAGGVALEKLTSTFEVLCDPKSNLFRFCSLLYVTIFFTLSVFFQVWSFRWGQSDTKIFEMSPVHCSVNQQAFSSLPSYSLHLFFPFSFEKALSFPLYLYFGFFI